MQLKLPSGHHTRRAVQPLYPLELQEYNSDNEEALRDLELTAENSSETASDLALKIPDDLDLNEAIIPPDLAEYEYATSPGPEPEPEPESEPQPEEDRRIEPLASQGDSPGEYVGNSVPTRDRRGRERMPPLCLRHNVLD